jgi:signal transduction histidine kinase
MAIQTKKHQLSTTNSMYRNPKSLFGIIKRLQAGLLPLSIQKKTIIINDADQNLSVFVDENILAFVIGSLMSNAVYSTHNCCIRVEASIIQSKILIRISNNGMFVYSSLMDSLFSIAQAAKKLNGHIALQSSEPGAIVAVFSMSSGKGRSFANFNK